MDIRLVKSARIILTTAIILQVISGALTNVSPAQAHSDEPIEGQVKAIVPLSIEMVDDAEAALAGGLSSMSLEHRAAFLRLYDPSGTGEIDEAFVATVVSNYYKIRTALEGDITVSYQPDSERCEGMRLYFTNLVSISVCPYFKIEENMNRKARVLIHEMAHKALLAADRHYFRPTSKAYLTLTPNGSWTAQLPVIGKLFRELAHNDTLYHPDAYAHFALAVSTGDYAAVTGR